MLRRQKAEILLVMEDSVKREQLIKDLEQLGHTVTAAQDSTEAIQKLQPFPSFDTILISSKALSTGDDPLLTYRRTNTLLHRLPIVILATHDEIDVAAHWLDQGIDDYLLEPFNTTLLQRKIDA